MKWFKHDAHSLRKAAIERLIMEYGIEGYGLYYACVEMIAGDIATDDLTFELKHDAELIAHKFKMDTIKVEKIMHRCIELALFDLADSGRLRCLRLAQMLDESTSRNPEMNRLLKNLHESGITSEINRDTIGNNSEQIPTFYDQKRIEEKRIEEKRINTIPEKETFPEQVIVLTNYFYSKMLKPTKFINNPPDLIKWYKHIHDLNRLDKIDYNLIQQVIDFAVNDPFWKLNIQSTKSLRDKFSQLEIKMRGAKPAARSTQDSLKENEELFNELS